ncbi:MAG: caspase family protein [Paludibacteraceae bacterium]|nr:caspase family protein [Paludibacteraceae bacterium]
MQAELNQNAIENSSKPYGTLEVTYNEIKAKVIPAGVILAPYCIYGIPATVSKVYLDMTFTIKDKDGKVIKEYDYADSEKSVVGLYYGRTKKVCLVDATRKILNSFKNEFTQDATEVYAKLKGVSPQNDSHKPLYATTGQGNITGYQKPSGQSTSSINSQNNSNSTYKSDVDQNIPITRKTAQETYVLIIANEEYLFVDPVNFASHDGEVFKEYCIKTLGIPEKQVRYCANASYGIISGGVDWLSYALNNFEGSKAIVYYCGHGIPDEKTGDAYIVPVDGKGTNTATCYSLNKLYTTLAATKAANITYFMDACFTGANKEGSMLVAARGVAREAKKEQLDGNAVVFSASSADETAMTYPEKGHGLFTYFLLKKLQETSGDVSYEELAGYINKNVKKEAFLINEKPQTPVVATSPKVATSWKTMKLK